MAEVPGSREGGEALRAFARYVERVRAGEAVDFDAVCRQQPGLAVELRRLRDAWLHGAGASPTSEASLSARICSLVGKDVYAHVAPDVALDAAREAAGDGESRIGRYRVRKEVARGGQGAILDVYDEDLRRHLAMKVVLGEGEQGADRAPVSSLAPRTLGRFLEEAQVTAQLDHPGIVPVHELGLDAEGRVYFTMRLVKGEDLSTIYAKTRRGEGGWSRTRALNVLVRVCEAMAYAHHKGVIHRDLKPANVMVGSFGEVYVMDWGLARVLERAEGRDMRLDPRALASRAPSSELDGEDALCTMDGDVVGTPAYMPPEQALGEIERLSPRSDVYAVGAMLYTLLAGHEPYTRPGERRSILDILLAVQSEAPHPLHLEAPGAPPELLAICEKAMQRDPLRRYADMSGLAEDLRAYLEGRVVQAHESGAIAELRKWVSRNRPLAAAMAAGMVALIAGLATTLVQKGRADRSAALAIEREQAAVKSEAKATVEAERANREAETARHTADFLVGLFEVVDPGAARGNTITAREILDRGAVRIDAELDAQPEVQSALMETMGTVYKSLGLYDQALPLLERSLARRIEVYGSDSLLISDTLTDLGALRRLKAEYAQAEPLLRQALELRRAQLGEEDATVAECMHELGLALSGLNRLPEAEELFRTSLSVRRKLLGRHPDVAESLNALAFDLFDQGDAEAPEELLRESLSIRQELLGEHPETAESLNDLGVYLFERHESEEAEELLRAALDMKRRVYTGVHPEVALSLNNLAVAYHSRDALDEAETLYLEALAIQRRLLGEVHPDIAQAMNNIAILRQNKGDWNGAKEYFLASLAMYIEVHGEGHPSVALPLQNTIEFLRELVDERRTETGEGSPDHVRDVVDLADVLVLAGNNDEAVDLCFAALDWLAQAPDAEPWQSACAESVMGAAWTGLGQLEQAEEVLLRSYGVLERERGRESPEAQAAIRRLVHLYELRERPEAAGFRALLAAKVAGKK
jgi:eukaryotic-like serine/threonine-protein kinase